MNPVVPLTHDVINFDIVGSQPDEVLLRFQGYMRELDGILRGPKEIIDSSFFRMGAISDEILSFAKKIELEMLRIHKSPQTEAEEMYAKVFSRNEIKMAFDLIMSDFVDRRNYLPERLKGDIDDTVGKLRNFLKHTIRDLVAELLDYDESDYSSLYVKLYFESLTIELKRTKELLDLIIAIQGKFQKVNMTPEIFAKMRLVFEKVKLIAPDQWRRIKDVLGNLSRFFTIITTDKKHLMRATDFFEFKKKMDAFMELSTILIEGHEAAEKLPKLYSHNDVKELVECTRKMEGILLDLGSFLEFMTYEVQKRECLTYKEDYLRLVAKSN